MPTDPRQLLGNRSEDRAAEFLRGLGFEILARNVSSALGEIDIVAMDGDTLVFVEVRSRTRPDDVHPAATVTRKKQRQIIRAAMAYCQNRGITDTMIRFDVVAVLGDEGELEHYPNAFQADR